MWRRKKAGTSKSDICWRDDAATRLFIRDKGDVLSRPDEMTDDQLAEAVTYCKTVENPFAQELCRRAGFIEEWKSARDWKKRCKVFEEAALRLGFRFY